jgi:hypothetical protein
MRTDGSRRSTPGNNSTMSSPVVTADGWVWFRGTDDGLWRMRASGSEQSRPGNNSASSPPFVTADGWVWFQGTDNALWRMRPDGREQSRPGNNSTSSTPFGTADGWVWFRGTDNALWRMRADGSERSRPGGNKTAASPTVTADGWVWFRGTDDKLWRMRSDGGSQTQVDGNLTASPLTVGTMTIVSGIAGEWVYWRGTNDKLWRDFVPASALGTETGKPAYYVLTAAYSPPGTEGGSSGSSVQYTSGSSTGTTTSTSKSFKAETEVGASGETVSLGGSFSASTTVTDTSSLQITKSQSYSFAMPGPARDGINHDYDLFLLLLNPLVTAQRYPQDVVLWSLGIESSTGTASIYSVYAGQLKGTMPMPPGLKAALDARGLTQEDYDQILSTNPFTSGSGTIDPGRYAATSQSLPYSPPPDPNTPPVTFTLNLSNEQIQTDKREAQTEYTVSMKVGISFFEISSKLTWTSTNSSEKTATLAQSASATVGGPAYGYQGPVSVLVYWDTLYSSFLFAFPAEPPSHTGTLHDQSGQPAAWEPVTLTVQDRRYNTLTDGLGQYRFYGAPHGQGTITVSHHIPVEAGGGSAELVT